MLDKEDYTRITIYGPVVDDAVGECDNDLLLLGPVLVWDELEFKRICFAS